MIYVSAFETIANFSSILFILSISVVVEVVGRCCYNSDEFTCVLNPGSDPEPSEKHEQSQIHSLFGPRDGSALGNQWVNFDWVERCNTEHAAHPDNGDNDREEEVKDWRKKDSLGASNEVSSSINHINGSSKLVFSAADRAQEN